MATWFICFSCSSASVYDEQPVSHGFPTVVWSGYDKPLVSRGFRIWPYCTSGARAHASCREIKERKFFPRTLSREKSPPNKRDLPSLQLVAEGGNLEYSSVGEGAIGAPTCPDDRVSDSVSPRSFHTFRRVQVRDLEVPANQI